LRPVDVRDLVLDVGAVADRPGHRSGDHGQVPLHRAPRGLRHDTGGPLRQGATRLDGELMYGAMRDDLRAGLTEIREAGLYKAERLLGGPQAARVSVTGETVLNF